MSTTATKPETPNAATQDPSKAKTLAELIEVTKTIDAFRGLSKNRPSIRAWVKSWPGLGSTRTYSLLLKGEAPPVDFKKKLSSYHGVLAALRANIVDHGKEPLYGDLKATQIIHATALRLMHHHGTDRLIIVEGPSGSGKSKSLIYLAENLAPGAIICLEADDTWASTNSTLHALLCGIGYGTTANPIPASARAKLALLVKVLKAKGRIILSIDEAHHMNASALSILKTLLNRTDVLMIIAGMKTLFTKLRASAVDESKQLDHNRLFARIVIDSPDEVDVRLFLSRRLNASNGGEHWSKASIKLLSESCKLAGEYSYLRKIVDTFLREETSGDEVDSAMLLEVNREVGSEAA